MTVAELLSESMAAHNAAKPSPSRARDLDKTRIAAMLRVQAEAADPTFSDPAWAAEDKRTPKGRNTHADLMKFYRIMGVL